MLFHGGYDEIVDLLLFFGQLFAGRLRRGIHGVLSDTNICTKNLLT